ncbi:DUF2950 domain-containing protein [Cupriavidus agavae]|uniref:DUF2950 family protein n=1 Tax=Cupriavidus agavae TaxID=1001822 RepID=A0A4Q7RRE0_9BURK|nr:DUF2950 domain-containing protein [Cupriavidus agavae]RZT36271.1 DUF2950 family protein [Cupriavidus agavae]
MKRELTSRRKGAWLRPWRMLALAAGLGMAAPAVMAQQVFPTPEAAMEALGDGVARSDPAAIQHVLGAQYRRLLPPQLDQQDVYDFLGAWANHHAVRTEGEGRASVEVGPSGWTFPVPIVQRKSGWQFDLAAGEREVRVRRIGRNEIVAMDTLLQLADAQQRYAEQVGKGAYARQLVSTPGKTNGLYWPSASSENDSPLGPDALAMVPETPADDAFYGYRFRVIAAPPGSAAGYALIAWPARYGETGVNTFMLDSDRRFFERDLGKSTASRAAAMRTFTTDGWKQVAEQ